ncbi:hypothetical protein SH601_16500 [Gracilibacillus sp. S3-1-1]|uniref:Uncharacterized protein n=1 Tax=Gracilibacillus pellucidus TaxID=3095368 RepID=A0ACC6M9N6_9BACI|nr:hypothetical protein [Gracilibacillus sp. S3-1-1]MDX8047567.1 hypothetical protein [Gracilibacillus sp. S3-1-1]
MKNKTLENRNWLLFLGAISGLLGGSGFARLMHAQAIYSSILGILLAITGITGAFLCWKEWNKSKTNEEQSTNS